jgi:hypothetical protein
MLNKLYMASSIEECETVKTTVFAVSPELLFIKPGIQTLDIHWNIIYISITT